MLRKEAGMDGQAAEAERFLEDETLAAAIMDIRLFRSREKH
ncbi:hypothetical protein [Mesorhizobium sp. M0276]